MALSAHQKQAALKQARLAEKGDSKALQFFANIQMQNPALYEEYKKLIDVGDEKAGGVKRSSVKVPTAILSAKQFQVAVSMGNKARKSVAEAVEFYGQQEVLAKQGSAVAQCYIAVRDEILARPEPVPETPIAAQVLPAAVQLPTATVTHPPVVSEPVPGKPLAPVVIGDVVHVIPEQK